VLGVFLLDGQDVKAVALLTSVDAQTLVLERTHNYISAAIAPQLREFFLVINRCLGRFKCIMGRPSDPHIMMAGIAEDMPPELKDGRLYLFWLAAIGALGRDG